MKWHDEPVDSKAEEDQEHSSQILPPHRPGDEIGSGFYFRRDAAERVTRHDEVDCDYREGDKRRRREVDQDFVRGSMVDKDVVVQRLVGDALPKQLATQRHPSTARKIISEYYTRLYRCRSPNVPGTYLSLILYLTNIQTLTHVYGGFEVILEHDYSVRHRYEDKLSMSTN